MSEQLAPLFESRETRLGRLPEQARIRFQEAEKTALDSGNADFADKQFVSFWLSHRTGLPRRDVLSSFDNLTKRYFGEGVTAAGAYDAISKTYQREGQAVESSPEPQDGGAEAIYAQTEGLPKATKSSFLAKVGQGMRAMGAGFEEVAQQVPAGFYSQAATVTGAPGLLNPMEDDEYRALKLQNAKLLSPYEFSGGGGDDRSFGPVLTQAEEELIAKNEARMTEIVRGKDAVSVERVKEWSDSIQGDASKEFRNLSKFWYELSKGASERMGVNPEFERTAVGGFMKSAGSVPATAALAVLGPAGWAGMESLFFAQVEAERMGKEGADYDPETAVGANLASALPQAIMERAFGTERFLNKVLGELPKMRGRVAFGDFVKGVVRTGLVSGTEEGITEPAQNFWNDYIASLSYDEKRELFTAEAGKQRLVESVSAFALGFVFGGGISTVETIDRNRAVGAGERYLLTKDGQPLETPDFDVLRQTKTDKEIMVSAPDVETGKVLVLAANGDKAAQADYNNRVKKALFKDTEGVEVEGAKLGTVNGVPAFIGSDGMVISLDVGNPEHVAFMDEFKRRVVEQVTTTDTLAQMKERFGENLEVSQPAKLATLQERVASGQLTQEQADDALAVAKDINGLAKELTLADVRPEGSATVRQTTDGIWKMVVEVAQSSDPTKAIEEVSEAYIHRAYKTQNLLPADLQAARLRWHEANGETDAAAAFQGDALDRANIEWFSKRVIDYALANRKTELPGGWGKWLRTLGEQLKRVLGGATRMRKLMREGKLDAELESWMKGALGITAEGEAFGQTLENQAARANEANEANAPIVGELDEEMMATAQADETFPKIERNDAGEGYLVSSPDGRFLGSRATMEEAQDLALAWFDKNDRMQAMEQAREESGEVAENELMQIMKRHKLPAPSQAGVFRGEMQALAESMTLAQRLQIFRKTEMDLDMVRQAVNEDGFNFETVDDFLNALDNSVRGIPVFGNQGGTEQVTFSLAAPSPVFYSRVIRTVEQSTQNKASGAQWKATIRNSKLGVNKDEFALVGVSDLEDGKTYTKAEVLDYLRANEVKVQDVTLGGKKEKPLTMRKVGDDYFAVEDGSWTIRKNEAGNWQPFNDWTDEFKGEEGETPEAVLTANQTLIRENDSEIQSETFFSGYTLPGAIEGSYREVLLTVPEVKLPGEDNSIKNHERYLAVEKRMRAIGAELGLMPGTEAYGNLYNTNEEWKALYDELFAMPTSMAREPSLGWRDGHSQYSDIPNPIVRLRYNERVTTDGKRMLFLEEVQGPQKSEFEKMPELFQKNWREIGFKWALRKAVDGGFDVLGWTTGDQQAERYDLSKALDHIDYWKDGDDYGIQALDKNGTVVFREEAVSLNRIEEVAGKGIAKRVGETATDQPQRIKEEGLKVGGEGLRKLYDSDFRNVVNGLAVVKKTGQKVGTAQIGGAAADRSVVGTMTFEELENRVMEIGDKWQGKNQTPEGYRFWNVTYDRQAHEVMVAMGAGATFEEALLAQGSSGLAEKLGVQIKVTPRGTPVHSLDLTSDIKGGAMQGQTTFSIAPDGSYKKGGYWYHGTEAKELIGGKLARYAGGKGSDMGGLFLADDSIEGQRYAAGYGRNLFRARVDLEEDQVFNLSNPDHVRRVAGIVLEDATGKDMLRSAFEADSGGSLDWAVVEPDVLEAAGFKAAILMERPAGMFGKNAVRSLAIFDASVVGEPERVSDADYIKLAEGGRKAVEKYSKGGNLTFALAPATESKAFKEWFGDSKVVDAQGKPLVVYHGTQGAKSEEGFAFDYTKIGTQGRSEGAGFYFTTNERVASGYAKDGMLIKAFLSIQKPMAYDMAPFKAGVLKKLVMRVAELEAKKSGDSIADGFLSNFGDVGSSSVNAVVNSAVNLMVDDATALDQISGMVGAGGSIELINQAVRDVTGYDGVIAKGFSNVGDADNVIYVAFFPEQVKSATGNRGTFDPTNADITFATTGIPQNQTQSMQAQIAAIRSKQLAATAAMTAAVAKGPLPKRAAQARRGFEASWLTTVFTPLTGRLGDVSQKVLQRSRRFEVDLAKSMQADFKQVEPFLKGFEAMRDADFAVLDLALKNGDTDTRDVLLTAYNLTNQFAQVEILLEQTRQRAKAAGFEVGMILNYFPRKVNDYEKLHNFYYGTPAQGVIEKAVTEARTKAHDAGVVLSQEQETMVINNAIQRFVRPTGSKPSNLKGRVTDVVSVGANEFYATSTEALLGYIQQINQAVEKRRFFGKHAVTMTTATGGKYVSNALAVKESVGGVVGEMLAAGEITPAQQEEVQVVMTSRFAQASTPQFVRDYKSLVYLTTMGQFTSAITQLGDTMWSLYESGFYETAVAFAKSAGGKSKITREDLGIEQLGEEFREVGKLAKLVDNVFKFTGLSHMDRMGKETLINAKFAAMSRDAKAGNLSAKDRARIDSSFEPAQAAQVIADLVKGKRTADTDFLLWSVLADYQPISLLDYPTGYLDNPRLRLFYTLKTYSIKHIESLRREAVSQMVHGNKAQKIQGGTNLLKIAGLFFMIGMPVDWIKDWLMMRDPQMGTIAVDNLFKLFGLSRWGVWQFRNEDQKILAAFKMIAPPVPFLDYPLEDLTTVEDRMTHGEAVEFADLESVRMIPFAGGPMYWGAGAGAKAVEKRMKKREDIEMRGGEVVLEEEKRRRREARYQATP